ncbi:hypothetical protein P3W85_44195 [Cupriavidus basilensis]|uniref:Uncharacterized protein n=1 Tax=Cupriavidus basilensis TaxID=68895 RepID=A0ABT6B580_9BURK|nr:hypothetical protein [Cupriavidus basilensis]MDF3839889.1 hypothetical protein [Cupriavidus basilensis]
MTKQIATVHEIVAADLSMARTSEAHGVQGEEDAAIQGPTMASNQSQAIHTIDQNIQGRARENAGEATLRGLIDKWLGPTSTTSARITRVRSPQLRPGGCVRVEVVRASDELSLYFFRHEDGAWRVFPPRDARLVC